jgi:hypothetical protein
LSLFSHMKGGELHPARNPWVGAGVDQKCGDSQRALVGDLAKRCVADACLLVRVDVGAGFQKTQRGSERDHLARPSGAAG